MIPRLRASDDALGIAVKALAEGKVVCVPTERWYMVCCDAAKEATVRAIHAAKQRPLSRPLLVVAPDIEALHDMFLIGPGASALIERFLPGELTLKVRWKDDTARVRYLSDHRGDALTGCATGVMGDLTRRYGRPLAATSANVSGSSAPDGCGPALDSLEAVAFIESRHLDVPLVVDGGICPTFLPTTIIDSRPRCPTGSR